MIIEFHLGDVDFIIVSHFQITAIEHFLCKGAKLGGEIVILGIEIPVSCTFECCQAFFQCMFFDVLLINQICVI